MSPLAFHLLGVAFALLAAVFWLWSAATRFPELRGTADTMLDDMRGRAEALRRQSQRNAAAALSAAGAAIVQGIAVALSVLD